MKLEAHCFNQTRKPSLSPPPVINADTFHVAALGRKPRETIRAPAASAFLLRAPDPPQTGPGLPPSPPLHDGLRLGLRGPRLLRKPGLCSWPSPPVIRSSGR